MTTTDTTTGTTTDSTTDRTTGATRAELDELRATVRTLSDRAEIAAVCDRYAMHLDRNRGDDDWFGAVFTEDVHLVFPMGEYKGMEGLAAFQRMARTTFARTHHLTGAYAIDLRGDEAEVRAHLTAFHVRDPAEPSAHFAIGGHYDARVVRTPAGWRIRSFTFDLVWNAGEAPGAKGHS
ncbi:nuclear transport factor 2 family protein [Streptomyces sp. NPDC002057]|uniref:nuclear transport factor 2 family protein n=1 Tax=Streptomyces sp. NPDC002057 TaxID=3154664 RepID=UPI00331E6D4D